MLCYAMPLFNRRGLRRLRSHEFRSKINCGARVSSLLLLSEDPAISARPQCSPTHQPILKHAWSRYGANDGSRSHRHGIQPSARRLCPPSTWPPRYGRSDRFQPLRQPIRIWFCRWQNQGVQPTQGWLMEYL